MAEEKGGDRQPKGPSLIGSYSKTKLGGRCLLDVAATTTNAEAAHKDPTSRSTSHGGERFTAPVPWAPVESPAPTNGQLAAVEQAADRRGASVPGAVHAESGKHAPSNNDTRGAPRPQDGGVNALVAKEGDDGMEVEEAGAKAEDTQLGAEGPGGAGTAGVRHSDATLGKRAWHPSLIQGNVAGDPPSEDGPSPKRTREVQGGQTLDDASDAGTVHGTSLMDGKGAEGVDAIDGGERGQGHDDTANTDKGRHDDVAGLGKEGGDALLDVAVAKSEDEGAVHPRPGEMTDGDRRGGDDAVFDTSNASEGEGVPTPTIVVQNSASEESDKDVGDDDQSNTYQSNTTDATPSKVVEKESNVVTPDVVGSGTTSRTATSGASTSSGSGEQPRGEMEMDAELQDGDGEAKQVQIEGMKEVEEEEEGGKGSTGHDARAGTTSGMSANEDTTPGGTSTSSGASSSSGTTSTNHDARAPGPNDILFGAGGATKAHAGNIKFLKLVAAHKLRYFAANKSDKPGVARDVVREWRAMDPPGRFLAKVDGAAASNNGKSVLWYDVGDKKARERASKNLGNWQGAANQAMLALVKTVTSSGEACPEDYATLVNKAALVKAQNDLMIQQQHGTNRNGAATATEGTSGDGATNATEGLKDTTPGTLVTPSTTAKETSADSLALWQRLSSSVSDISAADVAALLSAQDAPEPKSDVVVKLQAQAANAADNTGRFSEEEVQLFELGKRIFGVPNWTAVSSIVSGRDVKQVKARGGREKREAAKKQEEKQEEKQEDVNVDVDALLAKATAPMPTSAVVRKLQMQADAAAVEKRGIWSLDEAKLYQLGVWIFGTHKSTEIASIVPGRDLKQVKLRTAELYLLSESGGVPFENSRSSDDAELREPSVGFVAEFSTDGKTCPKCDHQREDCSYSKLKGIFYPRTSDEDDDPGHCPICYAPVFAHLVDNYVPGGEDKTPTFLQQSMRWEFFVHRRPPNASRTASASRNGDTDAFLQYCNQMNSFAGLGPPAQNRKASRFIDARKFIENPGDPLQKRLPKTQAGATLVPVELIDLTRDLARFQHPYFVGLGLIGEDDPPLALVPAWVSDGSTAERPEWQNQLSGTHRAFIKQITMLRAAYTRTGVKEGSFLSMLCEAGLEPNNAGMLSRFRSIRRENNASAISSERVAFIVESAYTLSFKRWAGLDVEEEIWPTPPDAIAQFKRYLAEPEQRKLLKEVLMHAFAQVAVVKAVIATGAIDKAQKMWKAEHNNAVYANELDARVKAGKFCVPECDCHEKGLATGGLVGELHHDGQEGEEAKRRWRKFQSGEMIHPSWYNDEQMDDQRKYLAALCERYHHRVTWSVGLHKEASRAMRQRLVRDLATALHPKCFVSDEAVTDENWSLHDRHHPFECCNFESGEKLFGTKKFTEISRITCGIHCASWDEFKKVVFRELLLTIDLDCRYHTILHWALNPDRAGFLKELGVYYPYKKVGDVVKLSKEDALEVENRFGKAAEEYIDALLSGSD